MPACLTATCQAPYIVQWAMLRLRNPTFDGPLPPPGEGCLDCPSGKSGPGRSPDQTTTLSTLFPPGKVLCSMPISLGAVRSLARACVTCIWRAGLRESALLGEVVLRAAFVFKPAVDGAHSQARGQVETILYVLLGLRTEGKNGLQVEADILPQHHKHESAELQPGRCSDLAESGAAARQPGVSRAGRAPRAQRAQRCCSRSPWWRAPGAGRHASPPARHGPMLTRPAGAAWPPPTSPLSTAFRRLRSRCRDGGLCRVAHLQICNFVDVNALVRAG